MNELKNLIIQVLDDSEKNFAESVLNKHGEVSSSECYVRGYGREEDVSQLRGKGMGVEVLSENISLKWMEPETQAAEESALLSDSTVERSPAFENSPLVKLAATYTDVCVIQLKGPLRNVWKEKLDEFGVELISYKPDFAYKSMLKGKTRAEIESLDFVARVVDLEPEQRLRRLKEQTAWAEDINFEQSRERIRGGQAEHSYQKNREVTADAISKTFDERFGDAESQAEANNGTATENPAGEINFEISGDEPEFMSDGAGVEFNQTETLLTAAEPDVNFDTTTASDNADLKTFDLKCHTSEQIGVVAAALTKDSRVQNVRVGRLRIRFDCLNNSPVLEELARMTQLISKIEPYIEPTLTNDFVRAGIGLEKEDGTPLLPWTGKNIIVAVADSGVDREHPDLKNQLAGVVEKASSVAPNDPHGHGTHVCGIIAGEGTASDGKLRGIAPDAKLFVQELLNSNGKLTGLPLDLAELFKEAYDNGARIHNNSWGNPAEGRYSIDSHEVDQFIYEHPDFLVIFSAGNDGSQTNKEQIAVSDQFGRILYWSLRSPATAKNALTVGACCSSRTDGPFKEKTWEHYPHNPSYLNPLISNEPVCGDINYLAAFSSRGPSDDDRIKPDIVAPGTVIVSARSKESALGSIYERFDAHYMYLSGTSQAAPVVAGAAAIVREFYIKEHNHKPSAALLRATLINGAKWINRDTATDSEVGEPNFHQGFGRLDLFENLPVPGNAQGFRLIFVDVDRNASEALNRNVFGKGHWTRKVQIEAGLPLNLTLAWTDKPGHGLQQNLDLVLLTPDGQRIVGNNQLRRRSFEQWDRDNNIERITVPEPISGEYTIHILAYNTPFENQGYSLALTGKLSSDFLN